MAIRNLRYDSDPLLYRKSREVEKVDKRIRELIDDMFDTMYKFNGVGLSAPQVGVLRRVIVIDTGEINEKIALVNPVVLEKKESCVCDEGCLSFPNLFAEVDRYYSVKVEGLNREGKKVVIDAKGLLAQALLHEIDHLNGIVFRDIAKKGTFFTYDKNGKKVYNVSYSDDSHSIVYDNYANISKI